MWHEKYEKTKRGRNVNNVITIRRDNKFEKAYDLPVISAPNFRSIFPKIRNAILDMKMRQIVVALCSETWEKGGKNKHKWEVERMLEMEGMKFISTARPTRRGGGCAIIADVTKHTLEKLDIQNPDNLEVCFGILRPKKSNEAAIKEHILISF